MHMMKMKHIILTSVLISSTFLISCTDESENKVENKNIEKSNIEATQIKTEKEQKEEVEAPEVSKQITEFPWDDKPEVKKAQEQNDANVLISGFCTVLEKSTSAERNNINLAAKSVAGQVIEPGEVFSQNTIAGPYTEDKGYQEGSGYVGDTVVKSMGGGVCKVATTLYNTAVLSDLEIVERYNHSMPVPYIPYGQDAAVAFGYKDLIFKNNTDSPVLVWAQLVDNRLYMAFYGKEQAPEVKWEHETINETDSSTKYEVNPELEDGVENTLLEGMDGKVLKSNVIVKDKNGVETKKDRGQSSYLPMSTVIEKNKK